MTVVINGTTGYSGPVGTIGDLTTTGNTTLGDASGDTLTINGSTTTLTQGTANGVAYLNGSKVLTTGSALTFDGTNLGLGVTPSGWDSGFRATQLGPQVSVASYNGAAQYGYFGVNWYGSSSGDKYIGSGYATKYQQDTGIHKWYTAPSGTAGNAISFTQAMTLDASGRLLVGGTSNNTGGLVQAWVNGTGTSFQTNPAVFGAVSTVVGREVPMIYGTDGTNAALISMLSGNMGFFTQGTERARIDSSGNLLVGATSGTGARLFVKGGADLLFADATGSNTGYVYRTATNSAQSAYFITSAGQAGYIQCTGNTTSYVSGSDYRLKDNIRPLTGGINAVMRMKPVAFEWKSDGKYGESFLAHELAEVCPQAVTGEKDAVDADGNPVYQGIDTSFLVATLTAAIQEQQAIIQQLQADVAILKGN